MIVPNAEMIEGAADQLKSVSEAVQADELKELKSALGAKYTDDIGAGYLIGLETARVMIQASTVMALSNIKIEDYPKVL